jgi:hypothetical protein
MYYIVSIVLFYIEIYSFVDVQSKIAFTFKFELEIHLFWCALSVFVIDNHFSLVWLENNLMDIH